MNTVNKTNQSNKKTVLISAVTILILSIIILVYFFYSHILPFNNTMNNNPQMSDSIVALNNLSDSISNCYNYNSTKSNYEITFLEFGATTCHECKKMEKVMEEVKIKYNNKVNVVFNNVKNNECKRMFDYFGIQMIPVQVLLDKKGKEYFRHLGYYSLDSLAIEFKKQGVF